ncbi:MAG TPA: ribbon-helix-helix domain-containing protein [Myxococcaceae bacterium]|nr:ribbon-helix-helix domain-containing protein [Myxococcaceae bacterium]
MEDVGAVPLMEEPSKLETVSTHVLVPEDQARRLRELSRRTRVAQSEYLREAVDDLLSKYERPDTA